MTRKIPQTLSAVLSASLLATASAQTPTLTIAEYQIDCNPAVPMNAVPGSELLVPFPPGPLNWAYVQKRFTAQIDTSNLSIGPHFLTVRVNDGTLWSHNWLAGCEENAADRRLTRILRVEGERRITGAEYFVGEKNRVYTPAEIAAGFAGTAVEATADGAWNSQAETFGYSVDTAALDQGTYSIFTRVKDQDNLWSIWRESQVNVEPPMGLQAAEWVSSNNADVGSGRPVAFSDPDGDGAYALTVASVNVFDYNVFPRGNFAVVFTRVQNNRNHHHVYTGTTPPASIDRGKWSTAKNPSGNTIWPVTSRVVINRCPEIARTTPNTASVSATAGQNRTFRVSVSDDDLATTDYGKLLVTFLVNGVVRQEGNSTEFVYTVEPGATTVRAVVSDLGSSAQVTEAAGNACESEIVWTLNVATPVPTTTRPTTATPTPSPSPTNTVTPTGTTIAPTATPSPTVATPSPTTPVATTTRPTTAVPTTTVPPTTTIPPTTTVPTATPIPAELIQPLRELNDGQWAAVTLPSVFAAPTLATAGTSLLLLTTDINTFGYFESRRRIGPFPAGRYNLTATIQPQGTVAEGGIFPELRLRVTGAGGLVNFVRADATTQGNSAARSISVPFEGPQNGEFLVSVDILRFLENQESGYAVTGFDLRALSNTVANVPGDYTGALSMVEANWNPVAFPAVFAAPEFTFGTDGLLATAPQNNAFGYWTTNGTVGPLAPGTYQLEADVEPFGALSEGQLYPELRLRVTSQGGLVNVFRADASTGSDATPRTLMVLFESAAGSDTFTISVDLLRFLEQQSGGYRITRFRVRRLQ
jgi:hypothetical protein